VTTIGVNRGRSKKDLGGTQVVNDVGPEKIDRIVRVVRQSETVHGGGGKEPSPGSVNFLPSSAINVGESCRVPEWRIKGHQEG